MKTSRVIPTHNLPDDIQDLTKLISDVTVRFNAAVEKEKEINQRLSNYQEKVSKYTRLKTDVVAIKTKMSSLLSELTQHKQSIQCKPQSSSYKPKPKSQNALSFIDAEISDN